MKRLFISFCVILSLLLSSKCMAQNWSNYLQFEGGLGLAGNGIDGCLFQAEYGKTYKALDFGLSLAWESTQQSYIIDYNDTQSRVYSDAEPFLIAMFNARFDLVKLFKKNARDSFKIGGGFGCATQFDELIPVGAVSLSYEYRITPDISFGTFYKFDIMEMGVVGLSVRRNF